MSDGTLRPCQTTKQQQLAHTPLGIFHCPVTAPSYLKMRGCNSQAIYSQGLATQSYPSTRPSTTAPKPGWYPSLVCYGGLQDNLFRHGITPSAPLTAISHCLS
ncbi:hypothetical protein ABG768_025807 [Culter alburnus]|uniref:Uncharacterized protein n=1 Tax=Culter alburnus TaxID=194366 RepID=A0AAW2AI21_CULAL